MHQPQQPPQAAGGGSAHANAIGGQQTIAHHDSRAMTDDTITAASKSPRDASLAASSSSLRSLLKRKEATAPPSTEATSDQHASGDGGTDARAKRAKAVHIPASAVYWQPRGWSQLATDLIREASTFLSLGELATQAMPICRAWKSAIDQVAPRTDKLRTTSHIILTDALLSPLRRHISSLLVHPPAGETIFLSDVLQHLIQRQLPQLAMLECAVDCIALPQRSPFPGALHTLRIVLMPSNHMAFSWSHVEQAMEMIAQTSTLTSLDVVIRELDGGLEPVPMSSSVFDPLAQLSNSLTSVALRRPDEGSTWLQREHIEVFRTLDKLTRLDVANGAWTAQQLEWLTAEPAPCQLEYVSLNTLITQPKAASIGRLISLRSFTPKRLSLVNASFLEHLSQVTTLKLACEAQVDIPILLAALAHCPLITDLDLAHPGMTDAHLCRLLSSLPVIRRLALRDMDALITLSFASAVPHLAFTLEDLTLECCPEIPPTELVNLQSLHNLRLVDLTDSFVDVDDATIALHTPGSATFLQHKWPRLTIFHWY